MEWQWKWRKRKLSVLTMILAKTAVWNMATTLVANEIIVETRAIFLALLVNCLPDLIYPFDGAGMILSRNLHRDHGTPRFRKGGGLRAVMGNLHLVQYHPFAFASALGLAIAKYIWIFKSSRRNTI